MKCIFALKLSKDVHLKIIFLCFIVLFGLIFGNTVLAQDCLDVIYHNKLYYNSYEIINGKKWIYEKKYRGSPLLMDNYWPKADISYNRARYSGILMNYDLIKGELIVYYPEKGKEKYVVISNDNLSGFSFTDTVLTQKHFYEYIELPGIRGKALYEKIYFSNVSFFIKPMKVVAARSTASGSGEYNGYYDYYLETGKGYNLFRTKSQFVKLLPEHKSEVNRFIRKNRLKINNRMPENIIAVLSYLDKLK